jgi:hypothetical protein
MLSERSQGDYDGLDMWMEIDIKKCTLKFDGGNLLENGLIKADMTQKFKTSIVV